jgi:hypothetical protein
MTDLDYPVFVLLLSKRRLSEKQPTLFETVAKKLGLVAWVSPKNQRFSAACPPLEILPECRVLWCSRYA